MLAITYSKLRQTRRALRVVKRAGERKRYLESDPVARVGLAGTLASMLGLNSLLDMFGLKIVAEKRVRPEVETEEVVEAVPELDKAEPESSTETLPEAETAVAETEATVPEVEAAVSEAEAMPEAITEGVPPALIDLMKANRDVTHQTIDTQL